MFWARPGRQTLIWEIYFLFFYFVFSDSSKCLCIELSMHSFFETKFDNLNSWSCFEIRKKNTSKMTCVWFKMNFFSWYSNIDNQWTWLCNLTQCTSKMCLFITHLYCFHFVIIILFYLYFLLDNFDWYRKEQYIWKLAFNQCPFF